MHITKPSAAIRIGLLAICLVLLVSSCDSKVVATEGLPEPTAVLPASPAPTTAAPPATATFTPLATGSIVEPTLALPSPSQTALPEEPLLSGSPEEWLPPADEIPAEMQLQDSGSGTNEEIANQFENSEEVLARLTEWGRLSNFMQIYAHPDACTGQVGLREVFLQTVLYETEAGAAQALAWYADRSAERADRAETTAAVGQAGHIFWLNDQSNCQPPDALAIVSIGFQRYNALGFVDVSSMAADEVDANMQTLALRLAQIIDYKLFSQVR